MKIAQLSPIRTQLSDSEQRRLREMSKRLVIELGYLEPLQAQHPRQELTMAIASIDGALDCIERLMPDPISEMSA